MNDIQPKSATDELALREKVRDATLADETALGRRLLERADIGQSARDRAGLEAASFVRDARANAGRSSLIDKFLQEYGLSTGEGVTLMRLAEALLRTPDAATADALIKDKVEAGDWSAHLGKSPFPLVNFSTRALMLTAAWLDDVEAKDPTGKIVKSTKALLDRAGDPVIRAAVGQAMRVMGEHFVLGQTIEEALRRGRAFADKGYTFSFDMLGEAALTAADADRFFADYSDAIAEIGKAATSDDAALNPGISVKLSALHPRYEQGKRARAISELGGRLKDLAMMARSANLGFNIDAEEADRLDLSLDLISNLLSDPDLAGWDGFGVVVQAYQRRAIPALEWLADAARRNRRRIMVRLVKGAYWDAEIKRAQTLGLATYPVFTRKVLTDISFVACARVLFDNADVVYPQFATHNALTAATVREIAGVGAAYELQRLHGMGEALHDRLLEKGARSRIYAPVGGHRELLPYLVRRLLENGANSSFVNQLIDPDLSVDDIVADPVEEALALADLANPAIPAPRDLFGGARLSAEGWDDRDPRTIAALEAKLSTPLDATMEAGPLVAGDDDKREDRAPRPVGNPARLSQTVGVVREADAALVAAACADAAKAAADWDAKGAADRAAILRRAADELERQAPRFFAIACQEAGKTIPDAIAEVREAVDFLRFYANEAERINDDDRRPLGVVACISPWNFPLAIFLGQVSAALAAGNAVVAKPAEQTPIIAHAATRLLHEAGVPTSVLQLLPGDGPSVGGPLVENENVAGVLFTGSTATAQIINRTLAKRGGAALIAETGGINAMIIDSTALMEQAVKDVVASAFQSAGQRCSACRIACVQEDVADRFEEMLSGAIAELSVGDPAKIEMDVGPIIDAEAKANIDRAIGDLEARGRKIAAAAAPDLGGHFVSPAAYAVDSVSSVREEIFGPVLQVVRFPGGALGELVQEINSLGYGLTLGAHTRIDETMHDIVSRARVGNIYVNRNQIGAVVGVQPFGGEGLSGTGPKAGGPHYVSALRPLRARPPHANAESAELPISEDAPALLDQLLNRASRAFDEWRVATDRREILVTAAGHAAARQRDGSDEPFDAAAILRRASTFAGLLDAPTDLPGPTGESNTLRLRGRGVALVLGPEPTAAAEQIAKALGAGDAVICDADFADKIRVALARAGAPQDLVTGVAMRRTAPAPLLADRRIALACANVGEAFAAALRRRLADRDHAIAPLLTRRRSARALCGRTDACQLIRPPPAATSGFCRYPIEGTLPQAFQIRPSHRRSGRAVRRFPLVLIVELVVLVVARTRARRRRRGISTLSAPHRIA